MTLHGVITANLPATGRGRPNTFAMPSRWPSTDSVPALPVPPDHGGDDERGRGDRGALKAIDRVALTTA